MNIVTCTVVNLTATLLGAPSQPNNLKMWFSSCCGRLFGRQCACCKKLVASWIAISICCSQTNGAAKPAAQQEGDSTKGTNEILAGIWNSLTGSEREWTSKASDEAIDGRADDELSSHQGGAKGIPHYHTRKLWQSGSNIQGNCDNTSSKSEVCMPALSFSVTP